MSSCLNVSSISQQRDEVIKDCRRLRRWVLYYDAKKDNMWTLCPHETSCSKRRMRLYRNTGGGSTLLGTQSWEHRWSPEASSVRLPPVPAKPHLPLAEDFFDPNEGPPILRPPGIAPGSLRWQQRILPLDRERSRGYLPCGLHTAP